MTLTPDQLREMYADIKVIKNNCERCLPCQKALEERLAQLEQDVTILKEDKKWLGWVYGWVYGCVGGSMVWVLSIVKDIFVK